MGLIFRKRRHTEANPPVQYQDDLAKEQEHRAKVQRTAYEKLNRERGGGGASYFVDEGTAGLVTKKKNPRKIVVCGIDPNTTKEEFHEFFKQFGEILRVDLPLNNDEVTCKGYGHIIFDDVCALDRIEAQGPHYLNGVEFRISREVEIKKKP